MRPFFPAALLIGASCALQGAGDVSGSAEPVSAESRDTTPDGVLIVLNKSAASADFIDLGSGEVLRTLDTGVGPHEGAVSPDGALAVVADYGTGVPGDTLSVFHLATGEVRDRVQLAPYHRPHGLAFVGPRRLLVTAETERALIEVDLETRAVRRSWSTEQDASHMVATSPDRGTAFVANISSGSCTRIDLATGEVRSVPTGAGAEGIDVHPKGHEVWVTNRAADTITVLDAATLEVRATLACPGFPIRVQFTPDGTRALVSCPTTSDVAVFDVSGRETVARIPMEFAFVEGAEDRLFGSRFGTSALPIGVLVHPDGSRAYVACAAADRVAEIDLASLTVTRSFATGEEPDGLAFTR